MFIKNLKIILILFLLGFIGILSMLTLEIQVPEEILEKFTVEQYQLLTVINSSLFVLISAILGVFCIRRVPSLDLPLIRKVSEGEKIERKEWLNPVFSVSFGFAAGFVLVMIELIYQPYIPEAFLEISEKFKPTIAARLLYGGITEEILFRFGLMSFLVFLLSKIKLSGRHTVYWVSIVIAALFFSIGHLPTVFQVVENPGPVLISYILIGNSIGGICFGWIFWKKGLESSFTAHMAAHISMVFTGFIVSLFL